MRIGAGIEGDPFITLADIGDTICARFAAIGAGIGGWFDGVIDALSVRARLIFGAFVLDIPRIIVADCWRISAAFFFSVGAGIGENGIDATFGIVANLSARAGLRDEDVIFANGVGVIVTGWILCRVAGSDLADAGITAGAGLCNDDAIRTDLQMVFV